MNKLQAEKKLFATDITKDNNGNIKNSADQEAKSNPMGK